MEVAEFALLALERYGIPLVCLGVLAWHHVRTVRLKDKTIAAIDIAAKKALAAVTKDKDAEIKRINEARIADAGASYERSVKVATEFTALMGETNQTLALLSARMPR